MKTTLTILLVALLSCSVLAQHADSARFYFSKGIEEKQQKLFRISSQSFEKALKFDSSFTDAHLEIGLVALEMRNQNLAINSFEKVHKMQPENEVAIRNLADLYFNYRRFNKAIEMAEKCKSCHTGSRIKGMSYYGLEDYNRAIKNLELSLQNDADDADAIYTIGRSYLEMELDKQALPYFEKAAAMPAAKPTWFFELGILNFNFREYKKSVEYFEKAASAGYYKSADYKENLGLAALYAGNYDKGESLLMEVWNLKPGNKEILRDLAEVLYTQKQYDRSLKYCQKLMELDEKDAKALYQAGLCFIKKGPKEKGEKMCDKAIELDPSLRHLREKQEIPFGGI